MLKALIVIRSLLAAIMVVAVIDKAHAQEGFVLPIVLKCNATKNVLNMLHESYGELPIGGGMSKGEQVRLFTSHAAGDKQTWTIIISNPNGLSCVLKGGEDWVVGPPIIKGDPS